MPYHLVAHLVAHVAHELLSLSLLASVNDGFAVTICYIDLHWDRYLHLSAKRCGQWLWDKSHWRNFVHVSNETIELCGKQSHAEDCGLFILAKLPWTTGRGKREIWRDQSFWTLWNNSLRTSAAWRVSAQKQNSQNQYRTFIQHSLSLQHQQWLLIHKPVSQIHIYSILMNSWHKH